MLLTHGQIVNFFNSINFCLGQNFLDSLYLMHSRYIPEHLAFPILPRRKFGSENFHFYLYLSHLVSHFFRYCILRIHFKDAGGLKNSLCIVLISLFILQAENKQVKFSQGLWTEIQWKLLLFGRWIDYLLSFCYWW